MLDGQDSSYYTNIPSRLGFTPVQQGGGSGQGSNKVYIGWLAGSQLGLQIDGSNFSNNWPINITGSASTSSNADTLDGVDSGGFMRREVNTWHASNEGAARFYFASGGRTYIRANNGDGAIVSFRGGDEVDKVHIGQDGNIWMAWLGDWMSNRLGQDVRSGASPTFSNIFASNATLTGDVTAGAFLYSSDAALKKNIAVSPGLEILRELRGVTFDWKANGKHASGVIAQEVEKVMPHAVKTGHEGTKVVDYLQLIAPLIEAAKELKTENDALKAQMDAHDRALRAANDNLARLEQEIQALKQSR